MARVMIIVWSWESSGIGAANWQIAGNANAGDQLIAVDWLANPDNLHRLEVLTQEKYQAGNDVLLFLHRQHGYHKEHVAHLVQQTRGDIDNSVFRCFLFGEGADPIYLTHSPRGLLGTAGTFSANVIFEEESLAITSIADVERKEIKTAHFDYVWQLYESAFEQRIFELKEDLLRTIIEQLGKTECEPGEVYGLLRDTQHRELLLRLLSFTGRIRKDSDLAREIRTFERNSNKSLTFDDCGIQLNKSYGILAAEQYALLVSFILRHVLAKGKGVSLNELRQRFDDLLEHIK